MANPLDERIRVGRLKIQKFFSGGMLFTKDDFTHCQRSNFRLLKRAIQSKQEESPFQWGCILVEQPQLIHVIGGNLTRRISPRPFMDWHFNFRCDQIKVFWLSPLKLLATVQPIKEPLQLFDVVLGGFRGNGPVRPFDLRRSRQYRSISSQAA